MLGGHAETLASVFSASDPDGDAITQYQLWFGIGSNPPLGVVTLNGTPIATQQAVTVSSLSGLVYTAPVTAGTDVVQMRGYDGTQWSSWVQQTITDPRNPATVLTLSYATPTIAKGPTEKLASVVSVS